MKTFNLYLLLAFASSLILWSCNEKSNLQPEGNWALSAPVPLLLNENNQLTLDAANPNGKVIFSWEAAESTAGYGIYYQVFIDSLEAVDASSPIASFRALESGKSTSASITSMELNDALYMAGFRPDEALKLKWTVVASCLSKTTEASDEMQIIRYDDDKLFLSGAATEVGDNISNALLMRRLANGESQYLNLYECYTRLSANDNFIVYNGRSASAIAYGLDNEGLLTRDGSPITVNEDGLYRINIDFDAMTIDFFRIDRMGIIGSPLLNGWGADEALEYKGMGVWQSDISFVGTGGYILRANNDWQGILKKVSGSDNRVIPEEFGIAHNIAFEDFNQDEAGYYTVTLTLTGSEYSLQLQKAPEQRMYVIVNGTSYEMTMVGDGIFKTTRYLALQTSDAISINTAADGSGTSYSTIELIGEGSGDKVEGSVTLMESSTGFAPSVDQAYSLTVDINNGQLNWLYYNIKLFHWDDDADGGWDARTETLMTYVHPYSFTVGADLQATHESKFNSPWDISFGADDETAMSGSMTNQGGLNFKNITSDGSYTITITVSDDYATGHYEFVMQ